VSRGTITGRENFAGNHESCGIWPEVLEEIRQAVEEDKGLLGGIGGGKFVVSETLKWALSVLITSILRKPPTHDNEQDGEDRESHELDGLATPGINEQE
jgi:hypothetical protein